MGCEDKMQNNTTKKKDHHRWVLHPNGQHSRLCHCRSYQASDMLRYRWHKGTLGACKQMIHMTLHRIGPRSQCLHHIPNFL